MNLDKNFNQTVHGYLIKNLVCQTSTFKVCDAIDKNGNSFVLKIFSLTEDMKVNLIKEEHIIESFVHNDKLFIVYAENNFEREGKDYFSYYMENNSNNKKNQKENKHYNCQNLKPIILNDLRKQNDSIIISSDYDQHLKFSDLKKAKHLRNFGLNSCANRLRTPIPKECTSAPPGTPDSFQSVSDDDDSDDSDENSEGGYDNDYDSDDASEEDSDIEMSLSTMHENEKDYNLIPILKVNNSISNTDTRNLNSNSNSNNTNSVNYTSRDPHIHIECPLIRIMHSKHLDIRKTPMPREMCEDNNSRLQKHDFLIDHNNKEQQENKSCGDIFNLQMLKSSMLRRRSSSKCEFST